MASQRPSRSLARPSAPPARSSGLTARLAAPSRFLVFTLALLAAAGGILTVVTVAARPLPVIPLSTDELAFSGAEALARTAALVTTFPERSDGKPDRAASAAWLRGQFALLGYETGLQAYSAWADGRYQTGLANVWAVKPGASPETIVVMAHYDIPPFVRQGAADDASGVGTLLELARVFAGVRTDRTLLFVAMDTEEYAMGGARALLAYPPVAGPLVAVVGLDYLNVGEMSALIVEGGGTRRGYTPLWLMTLAREAGARFTPLDPSTVLDQWLARSVAVSAKDAGMFVRAGIAAVNLRGLATDPDRMKAVYHTPQDTIDGLAAASFDKWGRTTELIVRSVDALPTIPAGPAASMTYLDLGLRYLYDDRTGVVLPYDGNGPLAGEDGPGRFRKYDQGDHFSLQPVWTPQRVEQQALLSPTLQVTLLVTERCTLRCRYCVYTGTYQYARQHSTADMPLDVATRAVDFLDCSNRVRQRHNPGRTPALDFYGGEPLLRMDLIEAVVDYTRKIGLDCSFNVTTNGTIDGDDVVAFLVRHKFNVAVSLDGPAGEQDRNRVFPSGAGSLERTYGFLRKLAAEHRKAGNDEKAPFMILVCADRATDLTDVCRFFDEDPLFRGAGGRVTMIYPYRTTYYDGWPREELERCARTAGQLWPEYLESLASDSPARTLGFRDWLFGMGLRAILQGLSFDPSPLRGACTPGARLAVDHCGDLHICERVNHYYPVGNLDTGLDLERVAELVQAFQDHLAKRCAGCNVRRLCGVCFANALTEGGVDLAIPEDFCRDVRLSSERNLSALYSVLERNPRAASLLNVSALDAEQDYVFNG